MNTYFEQMILSASPVELIRILYQQAASTVRDAREHLRGGRIAERSGSINNAYEVLTELIAALRPAEAPEIAARLCSLYCYMQRRLLEANFRQTDEPLEEVLRLLAILAQAWDATPELVSKALAPSNRRSAGTIGSEPMAARAVRA
ncbi:MAG: flagellar export chaperone FliS [Bryobacteraceae bacterium]|jgi:flagellar protein FliS